MVSHMGNASKKVTTSAATSGLLTAVLFGIQLIQDGADSRTWLTAVFVIVTGVGTGVAGYYRNETNPSPSARDAAVADVAERRRIAQAGGRF